MMRRKTAQLLLYAFFFPGFHMTSWIKIGNGSLFIF